MKKHFFTYVFIATVIFLSGCSDSKAEDENEVAEESETTVENSTEPGTELESLIGQQIEITEDGSIRLPFDDQVLAATFSNDGHVKFLAFDEYMILVEGEEIIHADISSPDHHLESDEIALSEDGRFATWRSHLDDFEISVYDLETREKHVVEKTEDHDPYNVFQPWLIEKHGDTYYLMTNDYWAALGIGYESDGSVTVLDLNNLEIIDEYARVEPLLPTEPIEDDDKYHTLKAEAAVLGMEDGMYSPYGYFKYFYAIEEPGEDEDSMKITNLYGGDTANSILKEIKLEDLKFGTDEIRVMEFRQLDTQRLQIADNGMFIIPVVDGNVEENDYTLNVYVADLTKDSPVTATLITETEVTDNRPSIFFNEDESAIYLSHGNIMERFELK